MARTLYVFLVSVLSLSNCVKIDEKTCIWCNPSTTQHYLSCISQFVLNSGVFPEAEGNDMETMVNSINMAITEIRKGKSNMPYIMKAINVAAASSLAGILAEEDESIDRDKKLDTLSSAFSECSVFTTGTRNTKLTSELRHFVEIFSRHYDSEDGPQTESMTTSENSGGQIVVPSTASTFTGSSSKPNEVSNLNYVNPYTPSLPPIQGFASPMLVSSPNTSPGFSNTGASQAVYYPNTYSYFPQQQGTTFPLFPLQIQTVQGSPTGFGMQSGDPGYSNVNVPVPDISSIQQNNFANAPAPVILDGSPMPGVPSADVFSAQNPVSSESAPPSVSKSAQAFSLAPTSIQNFTSNYDANSKAESSKVDIESFARTLYSLLLNSAPFRYVFSANSNFQNVVLDSYAVIQYALISYGEAIATSAAKDASNYMKQMSKVSTTAEYAQMFANSITGTLYNSGAITNSEPQAEALAANINKMCLLFSLNRNPNPTSPTSPNPVAISSSSQSSSPEGNYPQILQQPFENKGNYITSVTEPISSQQTPELTAQQYILSQSMQSSNPEALTSPPEYLTGQIRPPGVTADTFNIPSEMLNSQQTVPSLTKPQQEFQSQNQSSIESQINPFPTLTNDPSVLQPPIPNVIFTPTQIQGQIPISNVAAAPFLYQESPQYSAITSSPFPNSVNTPQNTPYTESQTTLSSPSNNVILPTQESFGQPGWAGHFQPKQFQVIDPQTQEIALNPGEQPGRNIEPQRLAGQIPLYGSSSIPSEPISLLENSAYPPTIQAPLPLPKQALDPDSSFQFSPLQSNQPDRVNPMFSSEYTATQQPQDLGPPYFAIMSQPLYGLQIPTQYNYEALRVPDPVRAPMLTSTNEVQGYTPIQQIPSEPQQQEQRQVETPFSTDDSSTQPFVDVSSIQPSIDGSSIQPSTGGSPIQSSIDNSLQPLVFQNLLPFAMQNFGHQTEQPLYVPIETLNSFNYSPVLAEDPKTDLPHQSQPPSFAQREDKIQPFASPDVYSPAAVTLQAPFQPQIPLFSVMGPQGTSEPIKPHESYDYQSSLEINAPQDQPWGIPISQPISQAGNELTNNYTAPFEPQNYEEKYITPIQQAIFDRQIPEVPSSYVISSAFEPALQPESSPQPTNFVPQLYLENTYEPFKMQTQIQPFQNFQSENPNFGNIVPQPENEPVDQQGSQLNSLELSTNLKNGQLPEYTFFQDSRPTPQFPLDPKIQEMTPSYNLIPSQTVSEIKGFNSLPSFQEIPLTQEHTYSPATPDQTTPLATFVNIPDPSQTGSENRDSISVSTSTLTIHQPDEATDLQQTRNYQEPQSADYPESQQQTNFAQILEWNNERKILQEPYENVPDFGNVPNAVGASNALPRIEEPLQSEEQYVPITQVYVDPQSQQNFGEYYTGKTNFETIPSSREVIQAGQPDQLTHQQTFDSIVQPLKNPAVNFVPTVTGKSLPPSANKPTSGYSNVPEKSIEQFLRTLYSTFTNSPVFAFIYNSNSDPNAVAIYSYIAAAYALEDYGDDISFEASEETSYIVEQMLSGSSSSDYALGITKAISKVLYNHNSIPSVNTASQATLIGSRFLHFLPESTATSSEANTPLKEDTSPKLSSVGQIFQDERLTPQTIDSQAQKETGGYPNTVDIAFTGPVHFGTPFSLDDSPPQSLFEVPMEAPNGSPTPQGKSAFPSLVDQGQAPLPASSAVFPEVQNLQQFPQQQQGPETQTSSIDPSSRVNSATPSEAEQQDTQTTLPSNIIKLFLPSLYSSLSRSPSFQSFYRSNRDPDTVAEYTSVIVTYALENYDEDSSSDAADYTSYFMEQIPVRSPWNDYAVAISKSITTALNDYDLISHEDPSSQAKEIANKFLYMLPPAYAFKQQTPFREYDLSKTDISNLQLTREPKESQQLSDFQPAELPNEQQSSQDSYYIQPPQEIGPFVAQNWPVKLPLSEKDLNSFTDFQPQGSKTSFEDLVPQPSNPLEKNSTNSLQNSQPQTRQFFPPEEQTFDFQTAEKPNEPQSLQDPNYIQPPQIVDSFGLQSSPVELPSGEEDLYSSPDNQQQGSHISFPNLGSRPSYAMEEYTTDSLRNAQPKILPFSFPTQQAPEFQILERSSEPQPPQDPNYAQPPDEANPFSAQSLPVEQPSGEEDLYLSPDNPPQGSQMSFSDFQRHDYISPQQLSYSQIAEDPSYVYLPEEYEIIGQSLPLDYYPSKEYSADSVRYSQPQIPQPYFPEQQMLDFQIELPNEPQSPQDPNYIQLPQGTNAFIPQSLPVEHTSPKDNLNSLQDVQQQGLQIPIQGIPSEEQQFSYGLQTDARNQDQPSNAESSTIRSRESENISLVPQNLTVFWSPKIGVEEPEHVIHDTGLPDSFSDNFAENFERELYSSLIASNDFERLYNVNTDPHSANVFAYGGTLYALNDFSDEISFEAAKFVGEAVENIHGGSSTDIYASIIAKRITEILDENNAIPSSNHESLVPIIASKFIQVLPEDEEFMYGDYSTNTQNPEEIYPSSDPDISTSFTNGNSRNMPSSETIENVPTQKSASPIPYSENGVYSFPQAGAQNEPSSKADTFQPAWPTNFDSPSFAMNGELPADWAAKMKSVAETIASLSGLDTYAANKKLATFISSVWSNVPKGQESMIDNMLEMLLDSLGLLLKIYSS